MTSERCAYLCCSKVGPIRDLHGHVVHRLHLCIQGLGHNQGAHPHLKVELHVKAPWQLRRHMQAWRFGSG